MSHANVSDSLFIGTVTDEKMGTFFGLATLALVFGLTASITDAPKERLPDVHALAFQPDLGRVELAKVGSIEPSDVQDKPNFDDHPTVGGNDSNTERATEEGDAHGLELIAEGRFQNPTSLEERTVGDQDERDAERSRGEIAIANLEIVPGRRPPPPEPRFRLVSASRGALAHQLYFDPESGIFRGELGSAANVQLRSDDVRRYRRIFSLQEDGQWAEADVEIRKLHDRRLMGHVLFQRLMHPEDYRSSYQELRDWLAVYGDHPGADRVYRLALRRQPAGAAAPVAPRPQRAITGNLEIRALWSAKQNRSTTSRRNRPSGAEFEALQRQVDRYLRQNATNSALRLLASSSGGGQLEPLAYDALRTRISAHLYYDGALSTSYKLASTSANRSGDSVPYAHWIAGLSAWRMERFSAAADHFNTMAKDPLLSPWQTAAAFYWAGRSYEKQGRVASARRSYQQASRHFRTFYGLIARRALQMENGFDWSYPPLTAHTLTVLSDHSAGKRAIALLQVGRFDEASDELKYLSPGDDRDLAEALVSISVALRLSDLALATGNAIARPDGRPYDAALYPLPHWSPKDGFNVDRALIYAFMRQESRFDPKARSYRGATGLMQLMPATAQYVSDDGFDYSGSNSRLLYDPSLNMSLGQRYLRYLLRDSAVNSNLFMLAAAYNGGPGNLRRWKRDVAISGDALLFIESIPFRETRQFVEKLLTNFWVYRMRLGQDTPSLDAIAAGRWPVFNPIDQRLTQVAQTDE